MLQPASGIAIFGWAAAVMYRLESRTPQGPIFSVFEDEPLFIKTTEPVFA
jgi:hypothetical protein